VIFDILANGSSRIAAEAIVVMQLIDVEILYLLKESSQTLYSLRGALADVFFEMRSFGTIHPHLVKLEDQGLIKGLQKTRPNGDGSNGGVNKRPFVLTRKGRYTLEKQVSVLAKTVLKMTSTA
jgi:DNA-binding PadR family transcriptional regulator